MSLRSSLERVMSEWTAALTDQFGKHPLAAFIRGDAAREVQLALSSPRGLTVKGSAGADSGRRCPGLRYSMM